MRHIAYRFLVATSFIRVGTGALARPSRAKLGSCLHSRQLWTRQSLLCAALMTFTITLTNASAETRPRYGGTLRILMQSAPNALELPANATPAGYWDTARTLSLIGDTLVKLDALGAARAVRGVAE